MEDGLAVRRQEESQPISQRSEVSSISIAPRSCRLMANLTDSTVASARVYARQLSVDSGSGGKQALHGAPPAAGCEENAVCVVSVFKGQQQPLAKGAHPPKLTTSASVSSLFPSANRPKRRLTTSSSLTSLPSLSSGPSPVNLDTKQGSITSLPSVLSDISPKKVGVEEVNDASPSGSASRNDLGLARNSSASSLPAMVADGVSGDSDRSHLNNAPQSSSRNVMTQEIDANQNDSNPQPSVPSEAVVTGIGPRQISVASSQNSSHDCSGGKGSDVTSKFTSCSQASPQEAVVSRAPLEARQNSITIQLIRRPLNPLLQSNQNTVVSRTTRQDSPKISNGSACLSLVKPSVQAQECSSDDLTVTVPPIRSEVMLNVSSTLTSTAQVQVEAPACPRPQLGPLHPTPPRVSSSQVVQAAASEGSQAPERALDSITSSENVVSKESLPNKVSHVAHCNMPRVKPRLPEEGFTKVISQVKLPPSSESTPLNATDVTKSDILTVPSSPSSSSDQTTSANLCQAGSSPQTKPDAACTGATNAGSPGGLTVDDLQAITPQINTPVNNIVTLTATSSSVSVSRPIPTTSTNCQAGLVTAGCSTPPSRPTQQSSSVSNLPPRPPSLKKLNLSPLQPVGSSPSSVSSPSGPNPPSSQYSSPRRSFGVSPVTSSQASGVSLVTSKVPISGIGAGTPLVSPGRPLPPLQTAAYHYSSRRPSVTSQDSASGCMTPTKPTPPANLPMAGRYQSPPAPPLPQAPPVYQAVSPVSSPYQDSPSNSRPPSWYGCRFFRGRDSSPSATSRDSLDSFIRSPPSGIFCTRNSVDNLLASRSSMDNISDTSGDSVFDDIMSESEKKSLDDSVGSLGSLNIADQTEGAVCLDPSQAVHFSSQDGTAMAAAAAGAAGSYSKLPSGGRVVKQESVTMSSTGGEATPSSQSDVDGGGGGGGGGGGVQSTPTTPAVTSGQPAFMQNTQVQVSMPSLSPELPPSYEEAIGLVPEGASSCNLLTYKDFVPVYNSQRRTWEPFNKVVLRANEWLVLNPEVRISSCESVLGFAAQSHGFNPDRAIGTRSQVVHENTYYLRFLRIWYSRLDQTSSDIEPQQIRYANFVSPTEGASISTLVDLINTKLNSTIKGDLRNVETLYILRKAIHCPDTPCWIERPNDPKSYSFFLRVFWLEPQEERQRPVKLGYMDLVPLHATGKNYPNDYEPFSVLMQVAQWWASHKADQGTHIINCQSLYVKRKALSTYWQRLHYTESAGGNNFLKNTYYNQILRVYFQTPTSCVGIPTNPMLQISYRTFTPVQLTSPTDPCLKFESFGETVNRVLHWLRLSGAQILSIETIKIRMYGGLQGLHGAESTLMRSEGRRYSDQEHWLHCIRVYLVGEYEEPDSSRIPPIPHVVPYFTTSPRPIAIQPPTVAFL